MTEAASNFAGVPSRAGGRAGDARVVLLPAPFEGTASYGRGQGAGPGAILAASRQVETRDDETGVDLEELSFALGPEIAVDGRDARAYSARVEGAVAAVVAGGKLPFVLGGEHSVTIGAVRAVRERHPGLQVLSIDAHADLRDRYEGGDHSHACVGRRVLEGGPFTAVGVRSLSSEEAAFAKSARALRLVSARDVLSGRVGPEEIVEALGDPVYLTVDVDGLDPSVVPATGTPEPGGLRWWDVLDLLRTLFDRRRVVGMDLVELAPVAGSHVSDFAVARLAAKMLIYHGMAG
ncbi:MAG: agmatinase [Synechococcaceae cyanobacterium]|nr:agmatinase [Synechococcaceae cyanobacterium]